MSMTDPIADLLTRIRNAILAKKARFDIPVSKVKLEVCRLLQEEGFIRSFQRVEDSPVDRIQVDLRYDQQGRPAIERIERVSKPGRRVYRGADDIKPVLNGLGVGIISTSKGLLTDTQAREQRIGGEFLCQIW